LLARGPGVAGGPVAGPPDAGLGLGDGAAVRAGLGVGDPVGLDLGRPVDVGALVDAASLGAALGLGRGGSTAAGLPWPPVAVRRPGAPEPGSTGPSPGTASRDSEGGPIRARKTTATYADTSAPSAQNTRRIHLLRRPELSTKMGPAVT
jgi:hypothetical protein